MLEKWTAIDNYISDLLVPADPVLDAVLKANADAGLPAYDISPCQGKLLYLLAKIQRANNILEIGTLGGYSTIWLARALPENGKLISLEYDPAHVKVAKANIALAGLSGIVEVRLGPALDTLQELANGSFIPFDLIFIDADKANNPHYLDMAIKLSRPGTVIIADNVIRNGDIINKESKDPSVQGIRAFYEKLSETQALDSIAVQTVGAKGHDGFSITIVS